MRMNQTNKIYITWTNVIKYLIKYYKIIKFNIL